jgi:hypothetical protein
VERGSWIQSHILIVLVLVFIATAALCLFLAVELARLMLGTERQGLAVDRLLHGVAGSVKGVLGAMPQATVRAEAPTLAEAPTVTEAPTLAGAPSVAGAPTISAGEDSWVRHDVEVEDLVRERLYGGRPARRGRWSGDAAPGAESGSRPD